MVAGNDIIAVAVMFDNVILLMARMTKSSKRVWSCKQVEQCIMLLLNLLRSFHLSVSKMVSELDWQGWMECQLVEVEPVLGRE